MSHKINNLRIRAAVIQSVRDFFTSKGFMEVETPHLIPANAPEEYIEPIYTPPFYLQTSPELCMKRLLCRGHEKIFQICRCWRSSERGKNHVPEFTMLEWYRADSDYSDIMNDCEELLAWVGNLCRKNGIKDSACLTRMVRRITVKDAFDKFAAIDMEAAVSDGSFDEVMINIIEPALVDISPVILMDYPSKMASLARVKPENPELAERFELYAGGLELANGFSELNDPIEQLARFKKTNMRRSESRLPPLPLPEPFLAELGEMPQSAGIALGVDRLVMLCAGTCIIDDVLAFTPEEL
jgi:lysyl-tRNA synthetase class 2